MPRGQDFPMPLPAASEGRWVACACAFSRWQFRGQSHRFFEFVTVTQRQGLGAKSLFVALTLSDLDHLQCTS